MSVPAIAVEHLVKIYQRGMAVDGISFALPTGSITGLLGGNGAGKTTTIAMIMGLLTPTSGTVRVLGVEMPRHRYRVRLSRKGSWGPAGTNASRVVVGAGPAGWGGVSWWGGFRPPGRLCGGCGAW